MKNDESLTPLSLSPFSLFSLSSLSLSSQFGATDADIMVHSVESPELSKVLSGAHKIVLAHFTPCQEIGLSHFCLPDSLSSIFTAVFRCCAVVNCHETEIAWFGHVKRHGQNHPSGHLGGGGGWPAEENV